MKTINLDPISEALPRPHMSLGKYLWDSRHPLALSRHSHRTSGMSVLPWIAGGILAGAIVAYYADPDRGTRRRKISRDRILSTFRRTSGDLGRLGRRACSEAYGFGQKATHPGLRQAEPANDAALARKVESELFRSRDVPKGRINVNAQEGIVILRGELERPEEITELVAAAGRIPGVRMVENLLHLQGTPAPNKEPARFAD